MPSTDERAHNRKHVPLNVELDTPMAHPKSSDPVRGAAV